MRYSFSLHVRVRLGVARSASLTTGGPSTPLVVRSVRTNAPCRGFQVRVLCHDGRDLFTPKLDAFDLARIQRHGAGSLFRARDYTLPALRDVTLLVDYDGSSTDKAARRTLGGTLALIVTLSDYAVPYDEQGVDDNGN